MSADNRNSAGKAVRKRRRKRPRQADEPSAMDLLEEGVHLLRRTSLLAWSVYLCGAVPFLLGFLFFWTEMATSGLAGQVIAPASLGMGLLFIWMKCMQAFFAKGLRDALFGQPTEAWSLGIWTRVVRRQAVWQPTGLFILPIASIITFPFAWLFAFYQNVQAADPTETPSMREDLRTNWRLARMWHEQNWVLLALISFLGLLVWLNWVTLLLFGPFLVKSLLGIETIFSKVGLHLLNSTALFACFLLTYLTLDPLVKAVYLLRRHYCESRKNGADLLLRLRHTRLKAHAGKAALLGIGFLVVGASLAPANLEASEVAPETRRIDAAELDASIEEVLSRREFVWRFPREGTRGELEFGWMKSFMDTLREWEERMDRWIRSWFKSEDSEESTRSFGLGHFTGFASWLSYVMIGAFVLLLVFLVWKAWRSFQPVQTLEGESEGAVESVPNLEDEGISADLLPRNRWLELAAELIGKGEFRLALRAYFLAQLSAFSSEGLIVVQQAKSNREYALELASRGHGRSTLLELYRSEMVLFESVWYGNRIAGPGEIQEMEGYLAEQGVLS